MSSVDNFLLSFNLEFGSSLATLKELENQAIATHAAFTKLDKSFNITPKVKFDGQQIATNFKATINQIQSQLNVRANLILDAKSVKISTDEIAREVAKKVEKATEGTGKDKKLVLKVSLVNDAEAKKTLQEIANTNRIATIGVATDPTSYNKVKNELEALAVTREARYHVRVTGLGPRTMESIKTLSETVKGTHNMIVDMETAPADAKVRSLKASLKGWRIEPEIILQYKERDGFKKLNEYKNALKGEIRPNIQIHEVKQQLQKGLKEALAIAFSKGIVEELNGKKAREIDLSKMKIKLNDKVTIHTLEATKKAIDNLGKQITERLKQKIGAITIEEVSIQTTGNPIDVHVKNLQRLQKVLNAISAGGGGPGAFTKELKDATEALRKLSEKSNDLTGRFEDLYKVLAPFLNGGKNPPPPPAGGSPSTPTDPTSPTSGPTAPQIPPPPKTIQEKISSNPATIAVQVQSAVSAEQQAIENALKLLAEHNARKAAKAAESAAATNVAAANATPTPISQPTEKPPTLRKFFKEIGYTPVPMKDATPEQREEYKRHKADYIAKYPESKVAENAREAERKAAERAEARAKKEQEAQATKLIKEEKARQEAAAKAEASTVVAKVPTVSLGQFKKQQGFDAIEQEINARIKAAKDAGATKKDLRPLYAERSAFNKEVTEKYIAAHSDSPRARKATEAIQQATIEKKETPQKAATESFKQYQIRQGVRPTIDALDRDIAEAKKAGDKEKLKKLYSIRSAVLGATLNSYIEEYPESRRAQRAKDREEQENKRAAKKAAADKVAESTPSSEIPNFTSYVAQKGMKYHELMKTEEGKAQISELKSQYLIDYPNSPTAQKAANRAAWNAKSEEEKKAAAEERARKAAEKAAQKASKKKETPQQTAAKIKSEVKPPEVKAAEVVAKEESTPTVPTENMSPLEKFLAEKKINVEELKSLRDYKSPASLFAEDPKRAAKQEHEAKTKYAAGMKKYNAAMEEWMKLQSSKVAESKQVEAAVGIGPQTPLQDILDKLKGHGEKMEFGNDTDTKRAKEEFVRRLLVNEKSGGFDVPGIAGDIASKNSGLVGGVTGVPEAALGLQNQITAFLLDQARLGNIDVTKGDSQLSGFIRKIAPQQFMTMLGAESVSSEAAIKESRARSKKRKSSQETDAPTVVSMFESPEMEAASQNAEHVNPEAFDVRVENLKAYDRVRRAINKNLSPIEKELLKVSVDYPTMMKPMPSLEDMQKRNPNITPEIYQTMQERAEERQKGALNQAMRDMDLFFMEEQRAGRYENVRPLYGTTVMTVDSEGKKVPKLNSEGKPVVRYDGKRQQFLEDRDAALSKLYSIVNQAGFTPEEMKDFQANMQGWSPEELERRMAYEEKVETIKAQGGFFSDPQSYTLGAILPVKPGQERRREDGRLDALKSFVPKGWIGEKLKEDMTQPDKLSVRDIEIEFIRKVMSGNPATREGRLQRLEAIRAFDPKGFGRYRELVKLYRAHGGEFAGMYDEAPPKSTMPEPLPGERQDEYLNLLNSKSGDEQVRQAANLQVQLGTRRKLPLYPQLQERIEEIKKSNPEVFAKAAAKATIKRAKELKDQDRLERNEKSRLAREEKERLRNQEIAAALILQRHGVLDPSFDPHSDEFRDSKGILDVNMLNKVGMFTKGFNPKLFMHKGRLDYDMVRAFYEPTPEELAAIRGDASMYAQMREFVSSDMNKYFYREQIKKGNLTPNAPEEVVKEREAQRRREEQAKKLAEEEARRRAASSVDPRIRVASKKEREQQKADDSIPILMWNSVMSARRLVDEGIGSPSNFTGGTLWTSHSDKVNPEFRAHQSLKDLFGSIGSNVPKVEQWLNPPKNKNILARFDNSRGVVQAREKILKEADMVVRDLILVHEMVHGYFKKLGATTADVLLNAKKNLNSVQSVIGVSGPSADAFTDIAISRSIDPKRRIASSAPIISAAYGGLFNPNEVAALSGAGSEFMESVVGVIFNAQHGLADEKFTTGSPLGSIDKNLISKLQKTYGTGLNLGTPQGIEELVKRIKASLETYAKGGDIDTEMERLISQFKIFSHAEDQGVLSGGQLTQFRKKAKLFPHDPRRKASALAGSAEESLGRAELNKIYADLTADLLKLKSDPTYTTTSPITNLADSIIKGVDNLTDPTGRAARVRGGIDRTLKAMGYDPAKGLEMPLAKDDKSLARATALLARFDALGESIKRSKREIEAFKAELESLDKSGKLAGMSPSDKAVIDVARKMVEASELKLDAIAPDPIARMEVARKVVEAKDLAGEKVSFKERLAAVDGGEYGLSEILRGIRRWGMKPEERGAGPVFDPRSEAAIAAVSSLSLKRREDFLDSSETPTLARRYLLARLKAREKALLEERREIADWADDHGGMASAPPGGGGGGGGRRRRRGSGSGDEGDDIFSRRGLPRLLLRVTEWAVATSAVYGFFRTIQNGARVLIDFQREMQVIKSLINPTTTDFAVLERQIVNTAVAYGKNIKDVAQATAEFVRQGYKGSEVMQATNAAMLLSNITMLTGAESAKALTTVMRQMGIPFTQVSSVIDRLTAVADTFAVSLTDLTYGLGRTGKAGLNFGMDLDHIVAVIATIGEATQKSGREVGTAWRTALARGFSDESIKQLKALGIQIYDAAGQVKSFTEVVDEIGAKWSNLSDLQRINLAEAFGGKRQMNEMLSLFDNFDRYQEALVTAQNASGSAARKNATVMDSVAKSWEQASAAVQGFIVNLGNAPLLNATSMMEALADSVTLVSKAMTGLTNIPAIGGLFSSLILGGGIAGTGVLGLATAGRMMGLKRTFGAREAFDGVLEARRARAMGTAIAPTGEGWFTKLVGGEAAREGLRLFGMRALSAAKWMGGFVTFLMAAGWAYDRITKSVNEIYDEQDRYLDRLRDQKEALGTAILSSKKFGIDNGSFVSRGNSPITTDDIHSISTQAAKNAEVAAQTSIYSQSGRYFLNVNPGSGPQTAGGFAGNITEMMNSLQSMHISQQLGNTGAFEFMGRNRGIGDWVSNSTRTLWDWVTSGFERSNDAFGFTTDRGFNTTKEFKSSISRSALKQLAEGDIEEYIEDIEELNAHLGKLYEHLYSLSNLNGFDIGKILSGGNNYDAENLKNTFELLGEMEAAKRGRIDKVTTQESAIKYGFQFFLRDQLRAQGNAIFDTDDIDNPARLNEILFKGFQIGDDPDPSKNKRVDPLIRNFLDKDGVEITKVAHGIVYAAGKTFDERGNEKAERGMQGLVNVLEKMKNGAVAVRNATDDQAAKMVRLTLDTNGAVIAMDGFSNSSAIAEEELKRLVVLTNQAGGGFMNQARSAEALTRALEALEATLKGIDAADKAITIEERVNRIYTSSFDELAGYRLPGMEDRRTREYEEELSNLGDLKQGGTANKYSSLDIARQNSALLNLFQDGRFTPYSKELGLTQSENNFRGLLPVANDLHFQFTRIRNAEVDQHNDIEVSRAARQGVIALMEGTRLRNLYLSSDAAKANPAQAKAVQAAFEASQTEIGQYIAFIEQSKKNPNKGFQHGIVQQVGGQFLSDIVLKNNELFRDLPYSREEITQALNFKPVDRLLISSKGDTSKSNTSEADDPDAKTNTARELREKAFAILQQYAEKAAELTEKIFKKVIASMHDANEAINNQLSGATLADRRHRLDVSDPLTLLQNRINSILTTQIKNSEVYSGLADTLLRAADQGNKFNQTIRSITASMIEASGIGRSFQGTAATIRAQEAFSGLISDAKKYKDAISNQISAQEILLADQEAQGKTEEAKKTRESISELQGKLVNVDRDFMNTAFARGGLIEDLQKALEASTDKLNHREIFYAASDNLISAARDVLFNGADYRRFGLAKHMVETDGSSNIQAIGTLLSILEPLVAERVETPFTDKITKVRREFGLRTSDQATIDVAQKLQSIDTGVIYAAKIIGTFEGMSPESKIEAMIGKMIADPNFKAESAVNMLVDRDKVPVVSPSELTRLVNETGGDPAKIDALAKMLIEKINGNRAIETESINKGLGQNVFEQAQKFIQTVNQQKQVTQDISSRIEDDGTFTQVFNQSRVIASYKLGLRDTYEQPLYTETAELTPEDFRKDFSAVAQMLSQLDAVIGTIGVDSPLGRKLQELAVNAKKSAYIAYGGAGDIQQDVIAGKVNPNAWVAAAQKNMRAEGWLQFGWQDRKVTNDARKGTFEYIDEAMSLINSAMKNGQIKSNVTNVDTNGIVNVYAKGHVDSKTNQHPTPAVPVTALPKNHTGGLHSDEFVAVLQAGEAVIPRNLVDQIPQNVLDKLPRYHSGGWVGSNKSLNYDSTPEFNQYRWGRNVTSVSSYDKGNRVRVYNSKDRTYDVYEAIDRVPNGTDVSDSRYWKPVGHFRKQEAEQNGILYALNTEIVKPLLDKVSENYHAFAYDYNHNTTNAGWTLPNKYDQEIEKAKIANVRTLEEALYDRKIREYTVPSAISALSERANGIMQSASRTVNSIQSGISSTLNDASAYVARESAYQEINNRYGLSREQYAQMSKSNSDRILEGHYNRQFQSTVKNLLATASGMYNKFQEKMLEPTQTYNDVSPIKPYVDLKPVYNEHQLKWLNTPDPITGRTPLEQHEANKKHKQRLAERRLERKALLDLNSGKLAIQTNLPHFYKGKALDEYIKRVYGKQASGLAHNEFPAILQAGEAVIPASLVNQIPQNVLDKLPRFHNGMSPIDQVNSFSSTVANMMPKMNNSGLGDLVNNVSRIAQLIFDAVSNLGNMIRDLRNGDTKPEEPKQADNTSEAIHALVDTMAQFIATIQAQSQLAANNGIAIGTSGNREMAANNEIAIGKSSDALPAKMEVEITGIPEEQRQVVQVQIDPNNLHSAIEQAITKVITPEYIMNLIKKRPVV